MIVDLATRAAQLIFCIIVLGLSIRAIQWQEHGNAPARTGYGAFAGALGLLISLVGIAALWISAISARIMMALDGVASAALLAGGVAFAIGMKGISCGSIGDDGPVDYLAGNNDLINGGCYKDGDTTRCAFGGDHWKGDFGGKGKVGDAPGRCRTVTADSAFCFLAFAASLAAAALCFLAHRRGGRVGKSSAV